MPPKRMRKPRSTRLARLGEALEATRRSAGFSQEELAARSGLHITHIGGLERGARNPTYETLGQLSDALGVSLSDLVAAAEPLRNDE
jgi:transcriptional regulator with XRE-family HTH domain